MTVAPTGVLATGKALWGLSTPSAGLGKRDVKAEDVRHCFTSLHGWEWGNTGSCFLQQEFRLPLPWHSWGNRKGDKYGARDTCRSSPACPLTWCLGWVVRVMWPCQCCFRWGISITWPRFQTLWSSWRHLWARADPAPLSCVSTASTQGSCSCRADSFHNPSRYWCDSCETAAKLLQLGGWRGHVHVQHKNWTRWQEIPCLKWL